MKAFISYSHNDEKYLILLTKHLAQLKRDGQLQEWTDKAIEAGSNLDQAIDSNLNMADLFIALLSPDYLSSNYCYEIEFKKAQELYEADQLRIIPVIVEDCDWLNSPFSKLKALPKDGQAISKWSNENTAMLDVIQNLRKVILQGSDDAIPIDSVIQPKASLRTYKVQTDFDSIQKMEFVEFGQAEFCRLLEENLSELKSLDGIQAKIIKRDKKYFECILVNRNKINTEATLKITNSLQEDNRNSPIHLGGYSSYFIGYQITQNDRNVNSKQFGLDSDEYELFWTESGTMILTSNSTQKLNIKEIVEQCWNDWLHSIGIQF